MGHSKAADSNAWAITDVYGDIRSISRAARELLGVPNHRRQNLLQLFADCGKALACDIEVALTGWPTERTLAVRRAGARASAVRYRVSRRLDCDRLELFWQLHADDSESLPRCA